MNSRFDLFSRQSFVTLLVVALLLLVVVGVGLPSPALASRTLPAAFAAQSVLASTSQPLVVSAGSRHTCARTGSGGIKCWGDNWAGQVGDDTTTKRNSATQVDLG